MGAHSKVAETGVARARGSGRVWATALACLVLSALAQPAEARRVALVVGNDSYHGVTSLRNARSDAKAVAGALRNLGFDVIEKEDLTDSTFKAALREFKSRIEGGDEVIFYFAGHGVQFGGMNYLVPVDIVADSAEAVADGAVPLQRVLDDLHEQKVRFALAIVDACRDNPFQSHGRALGGRGLAPVQAARGQIVVYSAAAGESALDRLGDGDTNPNGVFTRVLIQQISRPGVPADQLLKEVKYGVAKLAESAGQQQVPEIYDGSLGSFYLRPGPAGESSPAVAEPVASIVTSAPPPAPTPGIHVPTATERDELYWQRVRDSTDTEDFKSYCQEFPKGLHLAEAQLMIHRLARQVTATPAPAAAAAAPAPVPAAAPSSGAWSGSPSANAGGDSWSSGSGVRWPAAHKLESMESYERQDYGIPALHAVHSGPMHGPTPASIPGGRLITTKDLVALIQGNRTPYLLLDALGDSMKLPGALMVTPAAGPGTLGDYVERQLGQHLYSAVGSNNNVALIFYCRSNQCWMSYNAALRAIDLGYRNVYWYRGGIEAWTEAGLPTVANHDY